MKNQFLLILIISILPSFRSHGQAGFLAGADLSYVNEMEDCGAVYLQNNQPVDPYELFAGRNCNLVRLRLWHNPSWYDDLNNGKRYSDLSDVKKSIARARSSGMQVLLDFHLSDNWADPGNQLVPAAWLNAVDDLPVLQDSLYKYIYHTLDELHQEGLLPEMVQIGNETNKGILLSPDDNSTWTLDWPRNAALFNTAIEAVRAVENVAGKPVSIAIHVAGPEACSWLIDEFVQHSVTDFDVIGLSYYWQWHKPTTMEEVGQIIHQMKTKYPDKQVMILETGYPWTSAGFDNANNINNEIYPGYGPLSPENQKKWLIDLKKEVFLNNGDGMVYWEPAWVSTGCWTQWGEGSHYENATFFDFELNVLENGGINWMSSDDPSPVYREITPGSIRTGTMQGNRLWVEFQEQQPDTNWTIKITGMNGQTVFSRELRRVQTGAKVTFDLPPIASGIYIVSLYRSNSLVFSDKLYFSEKE